MIELAQVLAEASAWPIGRLHDCQPLSGGLSNSNYRLTSDLGHFVLRINHQVTHLQVAREQEWICTQRAAQAGLTSAIVYCDPNWRYWLRPFLEGGHWSPTQWQQPARLQRLLVTLRRLHAEPWYIAPIDLHAHLQGYYARLSASVQQQQQRYWPAVEAACACLQQRQADWVMAHNDLNPANLLDQGEALFLLDWEYAAPNDPLFELAMIAHCAALPPDAVSFLLTGYTDQPRIMAQPAWQAARFLVAMLDRWWHELQRTPLDGALDERAWPWLAIWKERGR